MKSYSRSIEYDSLLSFFSFRVNNWMLFTWVDRLDGRGISCTEAEAENMRLGG